MRNLYFKRPAFWAEVKQHCDDIHRMGQQTWHPHNKPPQHTLLSSPDLYPIRRSKHYGRLKKHTWEDEPIASYIGEPHLVTSEQSSHETRKRSRR